MENIYKERERAIEMLIVTPREKETGIDMKIDTYR